MGRIEVLTKASVFATMKELHKGDDSPETIQNLFVEKGQQAPSYSNAGSISCCPLSASNTASNYQESVHYLARLFVKAYLREKGL